MAKYSKFLKMRVSPEDIEIMIKKAETLKSHEVISSDKQYETLTFMPYQVKISENSHQSLETLTKILIKLLHDAIKVN